MKEQAVNLAQKLNKGGFLETLSLRYNLADINFSFQQDRGAAILKIYKQKLHKQVLYTQYISSKKDKDMIHIACNIDR